MRMLKNDGISSKRPVVRLVKALYGHPDAGTFWEQHCDESVRSMGFQPVGEEWPSVYTHPELQLVLVVYVHDLKMAGPKKNLKKGWELLREKLIIEPETGLDLYLGCNQSKGTVVLGNGHKVTTVTYDTEQFLRSCVDRYLEVAGNVELKKVPTPGPHEEITNQGLQDRPGHRSSAIGVGTKFPRMAMKLHHAKQEGLWKELIRSLSVDNSHLMQQVCS